MLVVMFSPLMLLCSFLVVSGPLISISSSSWSGVWVGMELNLFSFLVIMNGGGSFDLEPVVKYFVVQSMGSVVFIFGVMYMYFFLKNSFIIIMMLGLLMKIGIFPFHSWVPSVVTKSRWVISGLILTWQKLAGLTFLNLISSSLIFVSILSMVVVGSIGGLNQTSVRGMSSYSSFIHMSWMMAGLLSSFYIFFMYFFVYMISLFLFFLGCSNSGKNSLVSSSSSLLALVGIFMVMGVPPFIGFLAKLLVLLSSPTLICVICLLGSVVSLKFYVCFFYSILLNSSLKGVSSNSIAVSLSLMANFLGMLLFTMPFLM
uniref:NADH-ubiquinone oxidoreductase chain 2 n=1 Tax=Arcuatula senhousia TaxID=1954227 RepID=E2DHW9_ARCSE|nr:NADH dehydrogenase subunit 2 [Arcuatula senhousia]ACY00230.1 NADH dehydrogenase subunit 2 [Arcuatula senhousia]